MSSYQMANSLKCVVVGDGQVGKTSLLMTYAMDKFPEEHIPTIFDNYIATAKFENKIVRLDLWDTAGQDSYEKLRPLSYPQTDVFLVCYSIDLPPSFQNVTITWLPEIRRVCPTAPVILIGTKSDLREKYAARNAYSNGEDHFRVLSYSDGVGLAKEIGAATYVECSAVTQTGVRDAFDYAIRAVLDPLSLSERKEVSKTGCCAVI